MKYKNFIVWSVLLMFSFCFLVFSPEKSVAQTRKKTTKKRVSKNKTTVKKTSAKQTTGKAQLTEAMVIGNSNPVLTNPQTSYAVGESPNAPKLISIGIVNNKALSLVTPTYPPAAKAVRASGTVNVQVAIDEKGNVTSSSALSGHPLLRSAAEKAARESKFNPIILSGQPRKVMGIIVYNFNAR